MGGWVPACLQYSSCPCACCSPACPAGSIPGLRRCTAVTELCRCLHSPAPPPLPACRCCLARELTKRYEEFWRGSLADALAEFSERGPRGEFVLLIEGSGGAGGGPAQEVDEASILSALRLAVALGESPSCAAKSVAKRLGVNKKLCDTLSLALQEEPGA